MSELINDYEREKAVELAFAANAVIDRIKLWKETKVDGIRIDSWGGFQHTAEQRAEAALAYQREGINRRLNEAQINEWVGLNETFDALDEAVGHLVGRNVTGSENLFSNEPTDLAA